MPQAAGEGPQIPCPHRPDHRQWHCLLLLACAVPGNLILKENNVAQVILSSDEFGREEFDYDTTKEARKGFERLKKACQKEFEDDGIERKLVLALDTWVTE